MEKSMLFDKTIKQLKKMWGIDYTFLEKGEIIWYVEIEINGYKIVVRIEDSSQ